MINTAYKVLRNSAIIVPVQLVSSEYHITQKIAKILKYLHKRSLMLYILQFQAKRLKTTFPLATLMASLACGERHKSMVRHNKSLVAEMKRSEN